MPLIRSTFVEPSIEIPRRRTLRARPRFSPPGSAVTLTVSRSLRGPRIFLPLACGFVYGLSHAARKITSSSCATARADLSRG